MSDLTPEERRRHFTRIYDTHYHRVLGFALRRLAPDDASDVVAETFAIAWRRLDRIPEGDAALYWLYATARRVLSNHVRGERRRRKLQEALERNVTATFAPQPTERAVAAALLQLRDDERELLLLAAWEGLDAQAIAAVLGCSRNAVRIRMHRARRRFAAVFELADETGSSGGRNRSRAVATREAQLRLEEQG